MLNEHAINGERGYFHTMGFFFSTLSPCDVDKNILLLSFSFLKCAGSHAPINFSICGKKGKVLNRENIHHSGEDVVIPNDVSLNKNELPTRAQFWS